MWSRRSACKVRGWVAWRISVSFAELPSCAATLGRKIALISPLQGLALTTNRGFHSENPQSIPSIRNPRSTIRNNKTWAHSMKPAGRGSRLFPVPQVGPYGCPSVLFGLIAQQVMGGSLLEAGGISIKIFTGPSARLATCMFAPKTPLATLHPLFFISFRKHS